MYTEDRNSAGTDLSEFDKFYCNLYNLQMLFMLRIENKFSECLASLHKHEGLQWKTFWRRFWPGTVGQLPPILFCVPQILLCSEKFVLNI